MLLSKDWWERGNYLCYMEAIVQEQVVIYTEQIRRQSKQRMSETKYIFTT
jgi:hypothetical protein